MLEGVARTMNDLVEKLRAQDSDLDRLCKENAALREALTISIAAMEAYEEKVDAEWGIGRSISTIEADGDLPHCIGFARAALQTPKD